MTLMKRVSFQKQDQKEISFFLVALLFLIKFRMFNCSAMARASSETNHLLHK